MLYKRAVLGASGIDLIPNISFWTTLPGLIKDGYLFFISPCIGSRSEYDAYERIWLYMISLIQAAHCEKKKPNCTWIFFI